MAKKTIIKEQNPGVQKVVNPTFKNTSGKTKASVKDVENASSPQGKKITKTK